MTPTVFFTFEMGEANGKYRPMCTNATVYNSEMNVWRFSLTPLRILTDL